MNEQYVIVPQIALFTINFSEVVQSTAKLQLRSIACNCAIYCKIAPTIHCMQW